MDELRNACEGYYPDDEDLDILLDDPAYLAAVEEDFRNHEAEQNATPEDYS